MGVRLAHLTAIGCTYRMTPVLRACFRLIISRSTRSYWCREVLADAYWFESFRATSLSRVHSPVVNSGV